MPESYIELMAPYSAYGMADPGEAAYAAQVATSSEHYQVAYGPFLPQDRSARILDIGCGQGHCLAWLQGLGYKQTEGVDYSPTMLAVAKTHLGETALHHIESLQTWLDGHAESYDVIVSNQVIEHFTKHDIAIYFPLMRAALKPGGVLMVQTPNMCSYGGIRHRYVDLTHEVGFTELSLTQVMRLAGFERIQMVPTRLPLKGGPKRILHRLLQRWQEAWLSFNYLIAMGTDRPQVVSANLTGIGYRPQGS